MTVRERNEGVTRKVLALSSALLLSAGLVGSALTLSAAANDSKARDGKVLLAANSAHIQWETSLSQTLSKAKQAKKWVLIDVYTDWCGWCKRLDKDVYDNGKVAAFINKSFVCMKANAEKGDGVGIAQKYGVRGFPCTIVLDPSGNLKGQFSGYLPADQFPQKLSEIITGK